jgi:hypothetical protein
MKGIVVPIEWGIEMEDLQVILGIFIGIVMLASVWKVFSKAGEPGWAAIIPIFNLYVFVKISGKPIWWMVLFFIPVANLLAWIVTSVAVAERFGKEMLFGLGLCFLGFIFFPLLAFGDAQYEEDHFAKAA